jgi:hypothetical protein
MRPLIFLVIFLGACCGCGSICSSTSSQSSTFRLRLAISYLVFDFPMNLKYNIITDHFLWPTKLVKMKNRWKMPIWLWMGDGGR